MTPSDFLASLENVLRSRRTRFSIGQSVVRRWVLDCFLIIRILLSRSENPTSSRERLHLWIEIDGANGSLEWHQEEPNKMLLRVNGQPHRLYTRDPAALHT